MSEKTQAEILKEELFYAPDHASYLCDEAEINQADDFCEGYKTFLDKCKTEREAAAFVTDLAIKNGYVPFDAKASYITSGMYAIASPTPVRNADKTEKYAAP